MSHEAVADGSIRSIPNIVQKLKTIFSSFSPRDRSRFINQLPKIYENAQTKTHGRQTLEVLNLPRYKSIILKVGEFLENPNIYFKQLKSATYYPSVMNNDTGVRHFRLDLDQAETVLFLQKLLTEGLITPDYSFVLSEYQKNVYSGNIVINPFLINNTSTMHNSGEITIELVEDVHAGLAYGDKSPIIIANSVAFGDSRKLNFRVALSYLDFDQELLDQFNLQPTDNYVNFADLNKILTSPDRKILEAESWEKLKNCERLVRLMIRVLEAIPKDSDNGSHFSLNEQAPHPGYYEFIVNSENNFFFLDYREPLHYSNLQPTDVEEEVI